MLRDPPFQSSKGWSRVQDSVYGKDVFGERSYYDAVKVRFLVS
jgi:hypothetical protein